MKVLIAQQCLTLCNSMDCSPQQAPLSMGFPKREYWSSLTFLSPGDLPDPGIEPRSPPLWADSLLSEALGSSPYILCIVVSICQSQILSLFLLPSFSPLVTQVYFLCLVNLFLFSYCVHLCDFVKFTVSVISYTYICLTSLSMIISRSIHSWPLPFPLSSKLFFTISATAGWWVEWLGTTLSFFLPPSSNQRAENNFILIFLTYLAFLFLRTSPLRQPHLCGCYFCKGSYRLCPKYQFC